MVQDYLEDLVDPEDLWILEDQVDLASRAVLEFQELLAVQVIPLLLSLQNDWWRSHHLGHPFVLADQVDPAFLAVRGSQNFQGNLSHPLFRCNLALLSGLEVRPAQVDLEVLVFLEILAIQVALLFLLDQRILEVHRYPSLLWVRSAPQVQGILGLLAVR